jgi:hypothetical protein
MRQAEQVAQKGERGDIHRILVVKSEGKRPLGRLRCRADNNMRISHKKDRRTMWISGSRQDPVAGSFNEL